MGPMKFHAFIALLRKWNCRYEKTTKEWEVVDNEDNMRVSGFGSHGTEVKPIYVTKFLKAIRSKRGKQEP